MYNKDIRVIAPRRERRHRTQVGGGNLFSTGIPEASPNGGKYDPEAKQ